MRDSVALNPTILVPVAKVGFVIFARRGMAETVRVRVAQLRDAGVRLANVLRDMCVDLSRTAVMVMMQPFRAPNTSGIRKASLHGIEADEVDAFVTKCQCKGATTRSTG